MDHDKTADELLAELERNPEYLSRERDRMARRAENQRRYTAAAEGLLRDLAGAGFPVDTLSTLREQGVHARPALPVLLDWLPRIDYRPLKHDLIGTLGSPWARPIAAAPLVAEFRRTDPAEDSTGNSIRWAIGDALERVADESVIDDLIDIATDAEHGTHRAFVVAALGNMRKAPDRVLPVLLELLNDEDVAGYAILGLGKLKAAEARPAIEPFLDHADRWVRREAKKALGKLPAG